MVKRCASAHQKGRPEVAKGSTRKLLGSAFDRVLGQFVDVWNESWSPVSYRACSKGHRVSRDSRRLGTCDPPDCDPRSTIRRPGVQTVSVRRKEGCQVTTRCGRERRGTFIPGPSGRSSSGNVVLVENQRLSHGFADFAPIVVVLTSQLATDSPSSVQLRNSVPVQALIWACGWIIVHSDDSVPS